MVTPMIIPLRLSIIFVVFTVSIFVYYSIIKPANILKAGLILSIVAFAVALIESYVMHVYILKTGYRWMYLLPSAFALVLPFLIALLYKGMRKKA
jgi:hypothetical protein